MLWRLFLVRSLAGWNEMSSMGWMVFGTLLGPEITGSDFSCMPFGVCEGVGGFVVLVLSRAWPKRAWCAPLGVWCWWWV